MTKTSRGLRNNNPGNIRISKTIYTGEVTPSTDKSFKQFTSLLYGYRAMFVLLHYYQRTYMDTTIEAFIKRYAPSCENDTESYINTVCRMSGLHRFEPINTFNKKDMIGIVSAMSLQENGIAANPADVEVGFELFIKDKRK